jgi:alpha-1,3-rhamnosyl/mannosyltransferase
MRYALPEHYLVSVATLEPRKNLLGLIKAYSQLPEDYRNAYPLVLVGGKGWHTGEITTALAKLPERQLVRLGYVSQADLPKIISAASVMAYPSFYEGFGMPVLEAMAAGTPVLTSDCSSMPEVSGGAAVLIDPTECDSIAEGLRNLLDCAALRERCREKGLLNATRYSWQQSSERLIGALQNCHQGRYD